MSDTPRTDAILSQIPGGQTCDPQLVVDELRPKIAELERELAETAKDYRCLAELLDGHDATECRANLARLKADLAAAKAREKQAVEQRDAAKSTRAELLRHLDAARENERKAKVQLILAQQMHEAERALADRLALSLDIALGDWSELYATHETPAYDEAQVTLAAWKEARRGTD